MKIVIDTNVVISGTFFGGAPRRIIESVGKNGIHACATPEIIEEYEEIVEEMIKVDGARGDLDILFVSPKAHSKGIGYQAWCEVEKMHPEVEVWEMVTPYFEKRNIHFYVNRCGFHIVEFYNSHHLNPNDLDAELGEPDDQFLDGMFRFEKRMK